MLPAIVYKIRMADKKYNADNIYDEYAKTISNPPVRGKLKGIIMRFPVADGYCYYIITKETKKYVYLKRLMVKDYEDYVEPALGNGGVMGIEQAFVHIYQSYKFHKMLG